MDITLSTGTTTIRKLSLFELDHLAPDHMGKMTYEIDVLGIKYDVEYDIETIETPPIKPETPEHEIIEKSNEFYELNEWKLYQSALLHEKRRQELTESYYEKVTRYILSNCIDDVNLIATEEDWIKVYDSVLVESLTMNHISDALNRTYGAKFEGEPILDALEGLSKGAGEYNTIRLWENKLMVSMRLTELEYSLLPIQERARKVCSIFLDDMMSYLEMEKSRKESEAKSKNG